MARLKLTYFNGRGRAELIRFILAQADVAYEDVRLTKEEWPRYKELMPFGVIPAWQEEESGLLMGHSISIARYLANKYNLAGRGELEKARADFLVSFIVDQAESK